MRLRKADRELLAAIDSLVTESDDLLDKADLKLWSSFYSRVEADGAKAKHKGGGVSVVDAIEVFKKVLGKRLVLPAGKPGPAWFIPLQNRLNQSGITLALATEAARAAGSEWKGPIKAESIIRQCDTLLSEASVSASVEMRTEAQDMEDL